MDAACEGWWLPWLRLEGVGVRPLRVVAVVLVQQRFQVCIDSVVLPGGRILGEKEQGSEKRSPTHSYVGRTRQTLGVWGVRQNHHMIREITHRMISWCGSDGDAPVPTTAGHDPL